jgi:hypothetical protein
LAEFTQVPTFTKSLLHFFFKFYCLLHRRDYKGDVNILTS